tara:strand:- start:2851 stop:3381 length:531 start_codon:yes stop_codon:yes gene_type:complete
MEDDKRVNQHDINTSIFECNLNANEYLIDLVKNLPLEKKENFTSYLNLENEKQIIEAITKYYHKNFEELIKVLYNKNNYEITNAWVQKYNESYHTLHTHGTDKSVKSFVWYIHADEDSSPIKFYNPGYPYCYYYAKLIKPKANKFLLFDSYVPHEVLYNRKSQRVIISGNIKIWQK